MTIDHEKFDDRGVLHLREDGERVAYLTYDRPAESRLTITYVEVDPAHRGRGYAKRLVQEMVEYRERQGAKMNATCSVARAMLIKMGELSGVGSIS